MDNTENMPKLLAKADIAKRWGIKNNTMDYRSKAKNFPKPIAHIHEGKTPLFRLVDIEAYEEKQTFGYGTWSQKKGEKT